MGSKDRIQRMKDLTRANILKASLAIIKEEGWDALSMRKIAEVIEYTPPVIYEYFRNKDAILVELSRQGFLRLAAEVARAMALQQDPAQQLELMWLAYWRFAFAEKELYRIMFGVGAKCCEFAHLLPESQKATNLIKAVIHQFLEPAAPGQEDIDNCYYTFWSLTHGLISLNMVREQQPEQLNDRVLAKAIQSVLRSLGKGPLSEWSS
ncbi:TetR/AcrR family transcriptional regulator [Mucilaginibacter lappiensis]|uniref:TetR/AcrR family transcriptional regulator n=1 Tax=Mucilaginibacter lappiensis TaxID=354630 RepID=UPI003D25378F